MPAMTWWKCYLLEGLAFEVGWCAAALWMWG